jgi:hypothetical protein
MEPDETLEIAGRRVLLHLFGPTGLSLGGTTVVRVDGSWLVEETTGPFVHSKRVLPLAEVQSFQSVTRGNRLLALFGVILTPVFGLGLLLLVAWFFVRLRFFTIRHKQGLISLRKFGDLPVYEEFLRNLMLDLPAKQRQVLHRTRD